MKKEIKKIQDYFVSKIEAGEFVIISVSNESSAVIIIDGEYEFRLFFLPDGTMHHHTMDNFIGLPEGIDGTIFIERVKAQVKEAKLQAIEKLKLEIEKL